MATYIGNAFSLNMLEASDYSLLRVKKVEASEVPKEVESVIGHPDTATVVSGILGFTVPCNRVNLTLKWSDVLYVAQYRGPRLPEGATQLPEGASIQFLEVRQLSTCSGCSATECWSCVNMARFQNDDESIRA